MYSVKNNKLFILIIVLFLLVLKKKSNNLEFNIKNNYEKAKRVNEDLFLLSENGSSRATAYANLSKIIFIRDICVISWLGIEEGKFKPIVVLYDLKTKKIVNRYSFDESFDNHGVPTLALDKDNKIHIFYYPHGNSSIKYRVGQLAGNKEILWEYKENIGDDNLTYPNPIYHKTKGLYLFARKTTTFPGPNPLATYSFFRINENKNKITDLLISRSNGYAAFSSNVLMTDEKIQLLSRYHEYSDRNTYGRVQTISYIESLDNGKTWGKRKNDTIDYSDRGIWSWENLRLDNLITANKSSVIEKGGVGYGSVLNVVGIFNDHKKKPNLFYIKEKIENSIFVHATFNEKNGKWLKKSINDSIYPKLNNQRFVMPTGNLTKNNKAIVFSGVLQNEFIKRDSIKITNWGHKSNTVVLFVKNKEKYKILKEFKSRNEGVWFPYVRIKDNDLIFLFTKGTGFDNIKNNDAYYKTEVFLYHTKLDSLLNKDKETIFLE